MLQHYLTQENILEFQMLEFALVSGLLDLLYVAGYVAPVLDYW